MANNLSVQLLSSKLEQGGLHKDEEIETSHPASTDLQTPPDRNFEKTLQALVPSIEDTTPITGEDLLASKSKSIELISAPVDPVKTKGVPALPEHFTLHYLSLETDYMDKNALEQNSNESQEQLFLPLNSVRSNAQASEDQNISFEKTHSNEQVLPNLQQVLDQIFSEIEKQKMTQIWQVVDIQNMDYEHIKAIAQQSDLQVIASENLQLDQSPLDRYSQNQVTKSLQLVMTKLSSSIWQDLNEIAQIPEQTINSLHYAKNRCLRQVIKTCETNKEQFLEYIKNNGKSTLNRFDRETVQPSLENIIQEQCLPRFMTVILDFANASLI